MKKRPPSSAARLDLSAAFTLVELLVVIAIIAILMGLLFPAINIARDNVRKAQAKEECVAIVTAVNAYYTEYGKYPVPSGTTAPSGTTTDYSYGPSGKDQSNKALFDTLRAIDSSTNPRKISFYEGKTGTTSGSSTKGGFSTTGEYFDPWGYQYGIVIDSDYDNIIGVKTLELYTDFQETDGGDSGVRVGVGAFSVGKDGNLGTGGDKKYRSGGNTSDDVVSWQ